MAKDEIISKHLWLAGVATAVSSAVILAVAQQPSIWETWRPATCMPNACFCEAIRDQLVKQPANSISGLAFVGVGLLVLLSSIPASRQSLSLPATLFASRRIYPILFGFASLLIGFGTAFYHASLTFWGQTADVLGMYLIATFLVLYNLSRIKQLQPVTVATLYIAGNAMLFVGLVAYPAARRYAFAGLIVAALCLELAARRKERSSGKAGVFRLAIAFLAAGFLLWVLDITRIVCLPQSWIQGHAVWHIAGAGALLLVYRYYNSSAPIVSE